MPYANIAEQRAAKAASARRRRAAHRGTHVEPAVVAPEPTREDLRAVGAVLHCARADGEPDDAYRSRLRQAWQGLLGVVEP